MNMSESSSLSSSLASLHGSNSKSTIAQDPSSSKLSSSESLSSKRLKPSSSNLSSNASNASNTSINAIIDENIIEDEEQEVDTKSLSPSPSTVSNSSSRKYIDLSAPLKAKQAAEKGKDNLPIGEKLKIIRGLHTNVQDTLGQVQTKTTRILQDQERDLLRSFKQRLLEVQHELEMERKKNESGSVEWVTRCRKLTAELDWLRELTDNLTAENKNFKSENKRIHRSMLTWESDRQFLINQLVNCKKENARLRFIVEQQQANIDQNGDNNNTQEQKQLTDGNQYSVLALTSDNNDNLTPRYTSITQARVSPKTKRKVPPLNYGTAMIPPSTAPSSTRILSQTAPSNMKASIFASATTDLVNIPSRPHTVYTDISHTNHSGFLPESRLDTSQEGRYKSMISKLQRELDSEKCKNRSIRTAYVQEVTNRNAMQDLFKKCIEDVMSQNKKRAHNKKILSPPSGLTTPLPLSVNANIKLVQPPPFDPKKIDFNSLSAAERLTIIEWLLAHDNVLLFLFDKIFPNDRQLDGDDNSKIAPFLMNDDNYNNLPNIHSASSANANRDKAGTPGSLWTQTSSGTPITPSPPTTFNPNIAQNSLILSNQLAPWATTNSNHTTTNNTNSDHNQPNTALEPSSLPSNSRRSIESSANGKWARQSVELYKDNKDDAGSRLSRFEYKVPNDNTTSNKRSSLVNKAT